MATGKRLPEKSARVAWKTPCRAASTIDEIDSNFSRVAYPDLSPRVGRSQGASIFWGLVSVFFAAAACFYFWKNNENEIAANKWRDEVITLQNQCDELNSEKGRLQATMAEAADQLKTREDLVQEKETQLADEETRLEAQAQKTQNPPIAPPPPLPPPTASQSAMFKKFSDTAHKLIVKDPASDVITRGGRPVLRLAGPVLFAPDDAALKPDAKPLFDQIALTLNGQADDYELRIECFTDTEAETPKPHYATSWDLTSARAAAIARYFRDQTSLPFQNVLVIARGDSEPIVTGAKESHARNRRVEITLAPVINPLAPPPDAPAPGKAK
jgi:flagellar motor protein MotB